MMATVADAVGLSSGSAKARDDINDGVNSVANYLSERYGPICRDVENEYMESTFVVYDMLDDMDMDFFCSEAWSPLLLSVSKHLNKGETS